jgi:hypothetical protein
VKGLGTPVTMRTLLVLALVLGISFGLAFEPDSGTQAGVGPPDVHGLVLGANHAKPLPTVAPMRQLLCLLGIGVAAALVAAALCRTPWRPVRAVVDDVRHRSVFRSSVRARRGPPARA